VTAPDRKRDLPSNVRHVSFSRQAPVALHIGLLHDVRQWSTTGGSHSTRRFVTFSAIPLTQSARASFRPRSRTRHFSHATAALKSDALAEFTNTVTELAHHIPLGCRSTQLRNRCDEHRYTASLRTRSFDPTSGREPPECDGHFGAAQYPIR